MTSKIRWEERQFNLFQTTFLELSPYEQWVVTHTITSMIRQKDPRRRHEYVTCHDCMPGMYLFGVVDDGVGNKGVALQIHLDWINRILSPVSAKSTRS